MIHEIDMSIRSTDIGGIKNSTSLKRQFLIPTLISPIHTYTAVTFFFVWFIKSWYVRFEYSSDENGLQF